MMKFLLVFVLFFMFLPVNALAEEDDNRSVTDALQGDMNEEQEHQEQQPTLETDDAEETGADETSDVPFSLDNASEGQNIWFLGAQLVLALGLVMGVMYTLLKVFNRFNKTQVKSSQLENLGGISLGSNKSIQMIKLGSKVYVVGVGDNIELLTEVTDQSVIDALNNQNQNIEPISQTIGQFLSRNKTNPYKTTALEKEMEKETTSSFNAMFKGELDSMKEKQSAFRKSLRKED